MNWLKLFSNIRDEVHTASHQSPPLWQGMAFTESKHDQGQKNNLGESLLIITAVNSTACDRSSFILCLHSCAVFICVFYSLPYSERKEQEILKEANAAVRGPLLAVTVTT